MQLPEACTDLSTVLQAVFQGALARMAMGTSAGLEIQEKEPTEDKAKPNCTLFYAKRAAFPLAPPLMQILCPGSSCDPPPTKNM